MAARRRLRGSLQRADINKGFHGQDGNSVSSCKARLGIVHEDPRGDFNPRQRPVGRPSVASNRLGAESPSAGTGAARLHLAPKRARHHATAWLSRTWKGRPTRLLTARRRQWTHPVVYRAPIADNSQRREP
jgi:hypothetical protein